MSNPSTSDINESIRHYNSLTTDEVRNQRLTNLIEEMRRIDNENRTRAVRNTMTRRPFPECFANSSLNPSFDEQTKNVHQMNINQRRNKKSK